MQESGEGVLGLGAGAFCPRCGAPRGESECPCATRPAAPSAAADSASIKFSLSLYFFLLGACAILRAVALAEHNLSEREALGFDIASSGVISVTVLIAAATGWRRMGAALGKLASAKWFLIAPLGACATFSCALLASVCVNRLLGKPDAEAAGILETARWGWWVPILLVCVQPAVFEELAFRGLIQGSLATVLSRRDTVLVQALLFAILHLSPLSFPHLLVTGIALGVLRQKSGSVFPGMILHFCHNGLVVLAAYLTGG